ncbi:hypothetical protein GFS60_04313 [Rhodococcus sp. WAY2]|nr:hypothetical protein GFS60_04313 [Rhodococcus sp. WAY2]
MGCCAPCFAVFVVHRGPLTEYLRCRLQLAVGARCISSGVRFQRSPVRTPHDRLPAAENAGAPRCCQVGGQAATRG